VDHVSDEVVRRVRGGGTVYVDRRVVYLFIGMLVLVFLVTMRIALRQ
jgi:hypothetical protein